MRDIDDDNKLLASYGLPTIGDAEAIDGFSVGGCMVPLIGPLRDGEARPMVSDSLARGFQWGESYWGDKRTRKRSKVKRNARRELTSEQRAKLVAHRRQLVESTGRSFHDAQLDAAESMLNVEQSWKNIVDNR